LGLEIIHALLYNITMNYPNTERKMPSASFWRGFASAFNLSGSTFLKIPDLSRGFERDGEALRSDWRRIGNDMRKAMNQVSSEQR
jgi:hypothetical protein